MNLKKLLWIDFLLGFATGTTGLLFYRFLESFLQLPVRIVIVVSAVTLLYSLFAMNLARKTKVNIALTKLLVAANWLWAVVSMYLLYQFYSSASNFGKLFLILQLFVVAGLAYFEGKALREPGNRYV